MGHVLYQSYDCPKASILYHWQTFRCAATIRSVHNGIGCMFKKWPLKPMIVLGQKVFLGERGVRAKYPFVEGKTDLFHRLGMLKRNIFWKEKWCMKNRDGS